MNETAQRNGKVLLQEKCEFDFKKYSKRIYSNSVVNCTSMDNKINMGDSLQLGGNRD